MDVLGLLFSRAEEAGLLQQLCLRKKLQRISIYADDVALFLHPTHSDISITLDILELVGDVSGLHNNTHKSNIYPIRCSDEIILDVQHMLPCDIASFPCKYLGLPLSLHRLSNQQLWHLVDKIANRLPNWKADLLNRAGIRILVQQVLTRMSVHTAMAIDFPMWVIKEIYKIRKGFLWRGRREVKGGHCMISGIELQPEVDDKHTFSIASNGVYSAKTAYEGLFLGSVTFEHYKRIWKSWALPKCRFFLWLVAHKRCWTTDRLAKQGLNHPEKCLLCDQEEENMDHLLMQCSFSREFWYLLLRKFGLHSLAP
jgi:hypothetical protein